MSSKQPSAFVVSARCPTALLSCSAAENTNLVFRSCSHSCGAPFARLLPLAGAGPVGSLLPFARIGNAAANSSRALLSNLLTDDAEEQNSAPKRGHGDEWYQERCVFCASCKTSVNSTYEKRGTRCHGCRRWFHNACRPKTSSSSSNSNSSSSSKSHSSDAAATGEMVNSSSSSSSSSHETADQKKSRSGKFFHHDDCKEVYNKLAAVAATGEQQLTLPAQRSFLPWQQQQQEQQTWRLLDLAEVRHLYKDAQRRGSLFKQHAKLQKQLAAYEADSGSSNSNKVSTSSSKDSDGTISSSRVIHTRLDDFLTVCEVLKGLGDAPKDLLEDSFAIITRTDRGAPLCAGTFNVFGHDHARLQVLATPQYLQRHGHGSRLLSQLESVLKGAGVQQLVVILEPQDDDSSHSNNSRTPTPAVERWLRKGLGYKTAGSEQHMLWRRELPEYHWNLTAGCTLLVKPLTAKQKGWW